MLRIGAFIAVLLSPLLTLASPAIELGCRGYDVVNDAAVEFNVLYASWDRETGYGTQTVTLTKLGAEAKNEVYDLHDTTLPNCTAAKSVNRLQLKNKGSGVWRAVYTRACDTDQQFSIKATCEDL